MSKMIINTAEREASSLYKTYLSLYKIYPGEALDRQMENDYTRSAKKLIKSKTLALTTIYNKVFQEFNALTKQINDKEKNSIVVDQDLYERQVLLSLQVKLFEKTLTLKKIENQKEPKHPVEKNLLDHGYFGAVSPTKATIKQRYKTGVIQQERNGFRALYYENDRGEFLTSYDSKVFIGLFKLWLDQGKPETVSFDFSDLSRVLEIESNGGEYVRMYEALMTLSRTQITMEEYYDPTSNIRKRTIHHHPIKTLEFILRNGDKAGKERAAAVTFHEILQTSLLSGNYILINMVLFNDLQKPISKTLYLTLMNQIQRGVSSFEVDRLCEHLNLQIDSNRTQTVTALVEAFQELRDIGVLSNYKTEVGARRSIKFIHFSPSDWILKQNQSNISSLQQHPESLERVEQLTLPIGPHSQY